MLAITWAGNAFGQSSVLRSGEWHRFAIEKRGVYKISYDLLATSGINPAGIDPRKIRLFGNEGGMLPQPNNADRPADLTELAIFVNGEGDGAFNKEDYILFYGEGPDRTEYDASHDIFFYEHNLYSTKNFFFLTIGPDDGKRIPEQQSLPSGNHPLIQEFDDYLYHEVDEHNELQSGRAWFGEKFDITTSLRLPWDAEGVKENTVIKVVSDVMAQSGTGSSFSIYLNEAPVAEQYLLPVSPEQYAVKGAVRRDTFSINSSAVLAGNSQALEMRYQYNKAGTGRSIGYLNFVLLSFKRTLSLYGDQTIFRSAASLNNTQSTFVLGGIQSAPTIWDITDPYLPTIQHFSFANGEASFSAETSEVLREFVAFTDQIPQADYSGAVSNQDLHGLETPDLIIVTNPLFRAEAERLAAHRRSHSGWSVAVAGIDEVYNEFSSGRQDVTAIRDFVKYLYDRSPGVLKAVLLFGRGSYDYMDHLSDNTNFVPTYESRNSLGPLNTYSSDDYFTFMEDHEGNWGEDIVEYHTMDIAVGRLPVRTTSESAQIVDKIIEYESAESLLGNWRKKIIFVADDGDINTHQDNADQLAEYISANHPEFDTRKIYLDAFRQVVLPTGEASPETGKSIEDALDRGALIVNYTGHGNEKLWAQERIFDDFVIEKLTNKTYPLFVTATCEFGRQDDPRQVSAAEMCVLRPNSGAIAMVTTARPVHSYTNFQLNQAFYNALFEFEGGKPLTLGEVFRRTKNNSMSGVSNRNFSLLGDPSLQLAMPRLRTRITSITAGNTTDTLRALSRVIIKGEIVGENQERVTTFSGILQAVVYDKETEFTTLGNENLPFTFHEWSNALYRGQAEVTDGEFEFEFVVTRNIAYQPGSGKLSLYAYDKATGIDASGSEMDFVVGESESEPGNDETAPAVTLYIGDTTFRNGGITSPDTRLIARLADLSGINISGYGIGNSLVAVLDDTATYVLNDYYESDVNDFTMGWVHFPLKDLSPGRHTITVKAWDTYNNTGEASIVFIVSDGNDIVIEQFANYPNPFAISTTLFFTHNRSGDDLQTLLSIYDVTGRLLKTQELAITGSPYEVKLLELDTRDEFWRNLKGGLYLARLVVRSVTNGSKNEQVTKLIITN